MCQSRLAGLALASVSTLALTAAAQAQTTQPIYNWSGFYIGANAGAAWGRSDTSTKLPCQNTNFPPGFLCTVTDPAEGPGVAATGSGSISGNGVTGGVQAGYNWQRGHWVYGLEADFGALDLRTSRQVTRPYVANLAPFAYSIANSADTDWLFTVRGRVGWAFSNLLLYTTGGLAVTDLHASNSFSDNLFWPAGFSWSRSQVKAGWTLGGGVEWGVNRNWSVKAEYLYVKFGSVGAAGQIAGFSQGQAYAEAISTSVDLTAHIARAGINFRF
jgi:outer membrane immunogenic protein